MPATWSNRFRARGSMNVAPTSVKEYSTRPRQPGHDMAGGASGTGAHLENAQIAIPWQRGDGGCNDLGDHAVEESRGRRIAVQTLCVRRRAVWKQQLHRFMFATERRSKHPRSSGGHLQLRLRARRACSVEGREPLGGTHLWKRAADPPSARLALNDVDLGEDCQQAFEEPCMTTCYAKLARQFCGVDALACHRRPPEPLHRLDHVVRAYGLELRQERVIRVERGRLPQRGQRAQGRIHEL